jgi:hypothetical protein
MLQTGLGKYFNNPLFSDVVVVPPDGRRLHCHQLVLAAGSARFARMLEAGELSGGLSFSKQLCTTSAATWYCGTASRCSRRSHVVASLLHVVRGSLFVAFVYILNVAFVYILNMDQADVFTVAALKLPADPDHLGMQHLGWRLCTPCRTHSIMTQHTQHSPPAAAVTGPFPLQAPP